MLKNVEKMPSASDGQLNTISNFQSQAPLSFGEGLGVRSNGLRTNRLFLN